MLASATFTDDDPSKRPSVQVGDPFAEKLLIEASLELIERGLVEGLQDLGAGGITCATSETADRAGTGILVDLDAIPRREPGLEPFEVMISESQERMCAAVLPERWPEVREVCERWGLPVAIIGRVTADGDIAIVEGGLDADGRPRRAPARSPGSRPRPDQRRDRPRSASPRRPPTGAARRRRARPRSVERPPARARHGPGRRAASPCSGRPNLASRHAVFHQYDSTVGADTVAGPGRGAAVLRVKGTTKALVATTDGNQSVGALDPWLGAALSVAEATRNVSITGARPLGVTNCLNYGDPTRPEAFWQLTEGVRGLADACRALGLPVTGGNVSLYNESPAGAIAPTAEIGVVGLLDDIATLVGPAFVAGRRRDPARRRGGPGPGRLGLRGAGRRRLGGRPADARPRARGGGPGFVREAIARGLVASAQDVSGGGLAVALAECAMWGGLGAEPARAGRPLAGGRPVRRGPVAPRRHVPPALRRGADAARPPARPAGRDARLGRWRPPA